MICCCSCSYYQKPDFKVLRSLRYCSLSYVKLLIFLAVAMQWTLIKWKEECRICFSTLINPELTTQVIMDKHECKYYSEDIFLFSLPLAGTALLLDNTWISFMWIISPLLCMTWERFSVKMSYSHTKKEVDTRMERNKTSAHERVS